MSRPLTILFISAIIGVVILLSSITFIINYNETQGNLSNIKEGDQKGKSNNDGGSNDDDGSGSNDDGGNDGGGCG